MTKTTDRSVKAEVQTFDDDGVCGRGGCGRRMKDDDQFCFGTISLGVCGDIRQVHSCSFCVTLLLLVVLYLIFCFFYLIVKCVMRVPPHNCIVVVSEKGGESSMDVVQEKQPPLDSAGLFREDLNDNTE